MTFKRLLDEHDQIDEALGALEALVNAETADPIGAMLALSKLAHELRVHLANEDSMLYTRLAVRLDPTYARAAVRFATEFAELRRDWDVYLREWQLDSIESDWPTFCAETAEMTLRLAERVRAENAILYPTALRVGLLALRKSDGVGIAS